MKFSYLSFASLNHMERFGFSNTYGETSSLYSAAMTKKAAHKANEAPRKQIRARLPRCPGR